MSIESTELNTPPIIKPKTTSLLEILPKKILIYIFNALETLDLLTLDSINYFHNFIQDNFKTKIAKLKLQIEFPHHYKKIKNNVDINSQDYKKCYEEDYKNLTNEEIICFQAVKYKKTIQIVDEAFKPSVSNNNNAILIPIDTFFLKDNRGSSLLNSAIESQHAKLLTAFFDILKSNKNYIQKVINAIRIFSDDYQPNKLTLAILLKQPEETIQQHLIVDEVYPDILHLLYEKDYGSIIIAIFNDKTLLEKTFHKKNDSLETMALEVIDYSIEWKSTNTLIQFIPYLHQLKLLDRIHTITEEDLLILACQTKNITLLDVLYQHNITPMALPSCSINSLFYHACLNGVLKVVEDIVKLDFNIIYNTFENSSNVIHLAAESGSLATMEYLLNNLSTDKKSIIINKLNNKPMSKTPLLIAIETGDEKMASLLFENGASLVVILEHCDPKTTFMILKKLEEHNSTIVNESLKLEKQIHSNTLTDKIKEFKRLKDLKSQYLIMVSSKFNTNLFSPNYSQQEVMAIMTLHDVAISDKNSQILTQHLDVFKSSKTLEKYLTVFSEIFDPLLGKSASYQPI